MYMREIHSAALEYLPVLDNAAYTAATKGAVPKYNAKLVAGNFLKVRDNSRLQFQKIIFNCVGVHGLNLTTQAQRQKGEA